MQLVAVATFSLRAWQHDEEERSGKYTTENENVTFLAMDRPFIYNLKCAWTCHRPEHNSFYRVAALLQKRNQTTQLLPTSVEDENLRLAVGVIRRGLMWAMCSLDLPATWILELGDTTTVKQPWLNGIIWRDVQEPNDLLGPWHERAVGQKEICDFLVKQMPYG